jgi:hypothetical protein
VGNSWESFWKIVLEIYGKIPKTYKFQNNLKIPKNWKIRNKTEKLLNMKPGRKSFN